MSEDEAFENFKAIRWSDTDGEPVCPSCGSCPTPYSIDEKKW